MIIIMPKKVFEKKIRKLAVFKDYVVIDATDSNSQKISTKYSSVITVDKFACPAKVIKYLKGDDGEWAYDESKIKKTQKGWLKGKEMALNICSVVDTFLKSENQINIFIVLRNDNYALTGEMLADRFNSLLETDVKFVYTWEDGGCKSVLEKDLSDKCIAEIQDCCDTVKDALRDSIKKKKSRRGRDLEDDDDDYRSKKRNKSKNYKKYFKKLVSGVIDDDDDDDYFFLK